jgi:hypothetical protein
VANVNKRIAALGKELKVEPEEEEAKIDEEEDKKPEGEEMIMGAGSKESKPADIYKKEVDNLIIPGDEYY